MNRWAIVKRPYGSKNLSHFRHITLKNVGNDKRRAWAWHPTRYSGSEATPAGPFQM
jgi:hypothetical protein